MPGDEFLIGEYKSYMDPDKYAVEMGSLCDGCVNQSLVYHNQSRVVSDGNKSILDRRSLRADLGTKLATRVWSSLKVVPKMYVSPAPMTEWIVSDFDVLVHKDDEDGWL
ncbi:HCO3- transporter family, partial [Striga asiatica]